LKIEVKNWVTEFGILSLQKQRGVKCYFLYL
jgi:hypothetical protein